jgi:hypothetical protein
MNYVLRRMHNYLSRRRGARRGSTRGRGTRTRGGGDARGARDDDGARGGARGGAEGGLGDLAAAAGRSGESRGGTVRGEERRSDDEEIQKRNAVKKWTAWLNLSSAPRSVAPS